MKVLLPLPDVDFDVTEVAVPWRLLTDAGHEVTFATERGERSPEADPRLLTGVLFGKLGAASEPKRFYAEMLASREFHAPTSWDALEPTAFDGLVLPGGHAPGMRQYLGSQVLLRKVAAFWSLDRPVGAICHGVLVLARTRDAAGRSVIHDRRTTCLPKYMERLSYYLTAWRLGNYYRTYPEYVEDEVRRALDDPQAQFERGQITLTRRGTSADSEPAFVLQDGRYVSARWPGDAYLFAQRFEALLGDGRRASADHGGNSGDIRTS